MVKKLKQGQKYPEGFTQVQILLKLCGKDRTPTSEIFDFLKERFYIRDQKNIREHHLKILEKQKLIKRDSEGRGHPDYWYIIPDLKVLKEIIKRVKDYPRAHDDFMESKCYREFSDHNKLQASPEFVQSQFVQSQYFCNIVPQLNDEFRQKTSTEDGNPIVFFGISEEVALEEALTTNWHVLIFVLHFISISDCERIGLIKKIQDNLGGIVKCANMSAEGDMCENDELNLDVSLGECHGDYADVGEANDEISLQGDVSLYEPIYWVTLFIVLANASEIVSSYT